MHCLDESTSAGAARMGLQGTLSRYAHSRAPCRHEGSDWQGARLSDRALDLAEEWQKEGQARTARSRRLSHLLSRCIRIGTGESAHQGSFCALEGLRWHRLGLA